MTRQDLKDYRKNQEWLKDRLEYIEEYKTQLTKITNVLSDMPKGSRKVNDRIAENIVILYDNIEDFLKQTRLETKKQKAILNQLQEVEQPYRLILEKIYIQGKFLYVVADEMEYSYKHLCRQHGIALNIFDKAGQTTSQ